MKVALLTYACGMFSDPALEFAPRWINHHSKLFPKEDIHVVCNHVDESLYRDVNTYHRDHPEGAWYDVYWEMAMSYEAITVLRNTYSCIVFTSVDEFLCTRKPVADVVACSDEDWEPCKRIAMFDVIHDPLTEPGIDTSRPTLLQRKFWKYNQASSRPGILYSGLAPALGWHSLAGVEPTDVPFASDIFIAHLKREDFSSLHKRTEDRQKWPWGKTARSQPGLSFYNKIVGNELTEWYFHDLNGSMEPISTDFLEVP